MIAEIISVVSQKPNYDYEIICVNDFSPDNLYEVLKDLAKQNSKIKIVDLAKNSGKHSAVLTDSVRTIDGYDGEIPAITSIYPQFSDIVLARQWNGVGIKADAPQEVLDFYETAFAETLASGELDAVREARNTEYIGLIGEEAMNFIDECNSASSWTLWDIGVATISPEEFGIKPIGE